MRVSAGALKPLYHNLPLMNEAFFRFTNQFMSLPIYELISVLPGTSTFSRVLAAEMRRFGRRAALLQS